MKIFILREYVLEGFMNIHCVSEDINQILTYITIQNLSNNATISLNVWEHGREIYTIYEGHDIINHIKKYYHNKKIRKNE